MKKENNELGTGGWWVRLAREDAAAGRGRGQFTTSFVCPDKKDGCLPVAESEPVRVNTQNILEKPLFFKDSK